MQLMSRDQCTALTLLDVDPGALIGFSEKAQIAVVGLGQDKTAKGRAQLVSIALPHLKACSPPT